MGARRMETGLEVLQGLIPALRPESLVMLGKALQAIGEDLGAAQGSERLDGPAMLPLMPKADLSCYRVSVNRPRPGRDGGEWCLRVRAPGRSKEDRIRTGLEASPETRLQAEELARLKEHELNTGGEITFVELFDKWVDSQRLARVRPNTLTAYKDSRRWLLKCGLASLKDGELSRSALRRAKSVVLADLKATSANTRLSHMRQAWKWAWREEVVAQPWIDVGAIKVPKADRTKKRPYEESEIRELMEHFRTAGRPQGRYYSYVWAMAETGARADAMANVKGEDVSYDKETGGAWIVVEQDTVKTGEHRALLVSPSLAALLPRVGPSEFLWASQRRTGEPRPLNYSNVTAIIRRWLKERGLFGKRDLHSLRRSVVQRLVATDLSVEKARRVTGHSAKTFLAYASKSRHDLAPVFASVWLEPQVGPTFEERQGQLLHSEHSEQSDTPGATALGINSPIQSLNYRVETQVFATLRFAVNELGGWPQALSMLQRCVRRLRSEPPPTP